MSESYSESSYSTPEKKSSTESIASKSVSTEKAKKVEVKVTPIIKKLARMNPVILTSKMDDDLIKRLTDIVITDEDMEKAEPYKPVRNDDSTLIFTRWLEEMKESVSENILKLVLRLGDRIRKGNFETTLKVDENDVDHVKHLNKMKAVSFFLFSCQPM